MKEDIIEKMKNIGWIILGILFFIGLILIGVFIIKGALWIADKALPFLMELTGFISIFVFFIFLPMTILKETRKWGGIALVYSSLLFGLTLWVYSALVAYYYWGFLGLLIGIFILGIGVVPVGLLASLINSEWMIVGSIIYMLFITLGARIFGFWMVAKEENEYQTRETELKESEPKKSLLTRYNKLPEWLRWALFLPISLIITLPIGFIFYIISHDEGVFPFISGLIHPTISQIIFLLLVFYTVPRWKILWIKVLIILRALVLVILVTGPVVFYYFGKIMNYDLEFFQDLFGEVLTLIISLLLLKKLKNHTLKKQEEMEKRHEERVKKMNELSGKNPQRLISWLEDSEQIPEEGESEKEFQERIKEDSK